MAMTNNTWNYVTIAALTAPTWTGSYTLPPFIVDAIVAGTPVLVFCVYDLGLGSNALISFLTGGTVEIPSSAITIASTPAQNVSALTTGETWYSVRDLAGTGWLYYSDTSGLVKYMATSGPLGLFIT